MEGVPSPEPLQGTDWLSQLPGEVLGLIMGLLDLPTLYTARFICKCFRTSAAGHFKALDCTALQEPPTTDFAQFSSTKYLALSISHQTHLQSLSQPRIAPFVTHVSLKGFHLQNSEIVEELGAVLMRLPNLRSVSVQLLRDYRRRDRGQGTSVQGRGVRQGSCSPPLGEDPQRVEAAEIPTGPGGGLGQAAQPLEGIPRRAGAEVSEIGPERRQGPESSAQGFGGEVRLPLLPLGLEELKITHPHRKYYVRWAGVGDVSPLTRCSRLTRLEIELRLGAGTSMASLSSLRKLRSLALRSCSSALGVLSTFTALTSLTFEEKFSTEGVSVFPDLGRLTRLSRLALARIMVPEVVTDDDLTCIAQLSNLTCLEMSGCKLHPWVPWSEALLPLTRLVSLRFADGRRMPRLSRPQVEALHSLALSNVHKVSFLQWATRLTHLQFCTMAFGASWLVRDLRELRPVVGRMSNLRSLEISYPTHDVGDEYHHDPDDQRVFQLDRVLRGCRMLTKLHYQGWTLRPGRDLRACASLTGLRSLSFACIRNLTPACLPALQAMSGLTELSLLYTGIRKGDMTPDVIAAFDARRHELGWPLLKLRVEAWKGRRFERL